MIYLDKVPPVIVKMLEKDAQKLGETKWYANRIKSKDVSSGPTARHDVTRSVSVLAGSENIVMSAILSQCAEYGE